MSPEWRISVAEIIFQRPSIHQLISIIILVNYYITMQKNASAHLLWSVNMTKMTWEVGIPMNIQVGFATGWNVTKSPLTGLLRKYVKSHHELNHFHTDHKVSQHHPHWACRAKLSVYTAIYGIKWIYERFSYLNSYSTQKDSSSKTAISSSSHRISILHQLVYYQEDTSLAGLCIISSI